MKCTIWAAWLFVPCLVFASGKDSGPGVLQAIVQDTLKQKIQVLLKAVDENPGDFDLNFRLANLGLECENFGLAETAFKRCIDIDGKSADSYNGLGLAYFGKGEGAFIPIEAIKKLLKIDNYSKALRQFQKALEINPDALDPQYNIGRTCLAQGGKEKYTMAVERFQNVLLKDPEFKDADFMLGVSFQHLKDYPQAETVFKSVIDRNRSGGRAMIRLSEVYLETSRNDEATQWYYDGLAILTDREILDDLLEEIQILMLPEEIKEYKDLPLEERGRYFRTFWKKKDPNPATPENERYIEHFQRVKFALENYPDIIRPYFDDRGKVYVKYGPPDATYVSSSYTSGIRPNESWTYERSVQKGLTFDFVKKGNSYVRVVDLSEAAPAGSGTENRMAVMQMLYSDRADFTESYQRFRVGDAGKALTDFRVERTQALEISPAEGFTLQPKGRFLPFVYNLCQFRGEEGKSRTEVYIGVSGGQLTFSPAEGGSSAVFDYTVVFRDTIGEDVFRRKQPIVIRSNEPNVPRNKLYLYQEEVNLTSGSYSLSLEVDHPTGNAQGFYTNTFRADDFRKEKLQISGVQLASEIRPQTESDTFVKNGLQVVPYPYTVIRKQVPIFIYFEVYNLVFNANGQTDYTVTHSFDVLEAKRGFFSKTFGAIWRIFGGGKKMGVGTSYQQSGTQRFSPEYLSLDLRRLPFGTMRFVVNVKDNVSGESAERNITIQIVE